MRKYYQAALGIVAAVSLVALLFYRHEYNRLRYVLEVFNYFGNSASEPANCTDASTKFNYGTFERYENFDEPIPAWQRLNDEIYVYSAYRTNSEEIRAIALAASEPVLSCGIFYENRIHPNAGNFTHKLIELPKSRKKNDSRKSKSVYRGYQLICNYVKEQDNEKFVGMVKFAKKSDNPENNEAELILAVREFENRFNDENKYPISGICVAPFDRRPMIDADMIDFLSFHIYLGIEHFIVYDFRIAARFNAIMRRILPIKGTESTKSVQYTALPWNFPFTEISPDIVRSIIEADCLYRTYGKIEIIATLAWNEFIILRYQHTIEKLFRDIEKTDYTADRYEISSRNLCIDRTNEIGDSSIVPKILADETNHDDNRLVYIHRRRKSSEKAFPDVRVTRKINTDLIIANRYEERCDDHYSKIVSPDDRYVGKFSKIIANSTISKLFRLQAH